MWAGEEGEKDFPWSLFGEAAKFLIFSCLAPILPNPHPPPAISGFIVCLVRFFLPFVICEWW
jgi:hypothetical protein